MSHKVKVLGLALLAMSALSGIAASSALAVEGTTTPESFPATITTSQTLTTALTLGTGVRGTECKVVTNDSVSQLSVATSTVELKPTLSGCVTTPGAFPVTISVGACRYNLTMSERTSATEGHGSITITGCGTGSNSSTGAIYIVFKSSGGSAICEYEVGNQGPLSGFSWKSTAATASTKADVDLSLAVMGITAKVILGTVAACGGAAGNSVLFKDSGGWTMSADSGGVSVGVLIS